MEGKGSGFAFLSLSPSIQLTTKLYSFFFLKNNNSKKKKKTKTISPLPTDEFHKSLSRVQLSATPWMAAHQASLFFTSSWSLLKLMSIEWMLPANHFLLYHPLLLPSIFPSIRVFSKELALLIRWPQYWSFSIDLSTNPNKVPSQHNWLHTTVLY